MKMQDIMEMVGETDLKHLVDNIFAMAEENAYNAAASENRGVTGDDIFNETKTILHTVKNSIADRLQQSMR